LSRSFPRQNATIKIQQASATTQLRPANNHQLFAYERPAQRLHITSCPGKYRLLIGPRN